MFTLLRSLTKLTFGIAAFEDLEKYRPGLVQTYKDWFTVSYDIIYMSLPMIMSHNFAVLQGSSRR